MSIPTAWPGATLRASPSVIVPGPQPASSTRQPGFSCAERIRRESPPCVAPSSSRPARCSPACKYLFAFSTLLCGFQVLPGELPFCEESDRCSEQQSEPEQRIGKSDEFEFREQRE